MNSLIGLAIFAVFAFVVFVVTVGKLLGSLRREDRGSIPTERQSTDRGSGRDD